MTLHDACENFLTHCATERKLSPLTVRAYKNDLRCFMRAVGARHALQDLSEAWIETAIQSWTGDPALMATTVRRRVACVKAFVRWLFRRRLITFNPLERIHVDIKIPKRLPRNLQTTEIRKLIATKPESMSGKLSKNSHSVLSRTEWDRLTARLAIEVMTLTGIRVGELARIRLADMNDDLGQIRIVGKGDKERHVSFPDGVTIERLQRYRKLVRLRFGDDSSDALFLNGLGRPANEQYIRRILRVFAEAAELTRRITPHMLRHTAATQLLEAGLDIRFVQKLLGHASVTTTEIYTHVADHVLRAEIARANVRKRLEMHR
jgi:site-specific recombinase XerD